MEQFDHDYFAQRKEEIEEMYLLRSMSLACLVTGGILMLIGVIGNASNTVSGILVGVGILFLIGALFMLAGYFGQSAASRAVRREYQQLIMLNPALAKAKRGDHAEDEGDETLFDDGELPVEIGLDDQIRMSARSD